MKNELLKLQEAELLQQMQMGNEQAFELLMNKYYKSLYNYAAKFTLQKEAIKDCVQETFLSFWQRREMAGSILSLKYYLLLSVKNQVLNAIHRTKPTVRLYDDDGRYPFLIEFSIDKVLADQQVVKENAVKLQKIIQQLPARQKEVIYLKFYEQLDHGQISGIMDISHQSVYNLLHESIKKIREIWRVEFGANMACLGLLPFLIK